MNPNRPKWKGMPEYRLWCFLWPKFCWAVQHLGKYVAYVGVFALAVYAWVHLQDATAEDVRANWRENGGTYLALGLFGLGLTAVQRLVVYDWACRNCGSWYPWKWKYSGGGLHACQECGWSQDEGGRSYPPEQTNGSS